MAITRTGAEDFSSSVVTAGDGQPPKLEEYNAAARSFQHGCSSGNRARLVPTRLTGPDQLSRYRHRLGKLPPQPLLQL